jgi:hypothetical protein
MGNAKLLQDHREMPVKIGRQAVRLLTSGRWNERVEGHAFSRAPPSLHDEALLASPWLLAVGYPDMSRSDEPDRYHRHAPVWHWFNFVCSGRGTVRLPRVPEPEWQSALAGRSFDALVYAIYADYCEDHDRDAEPWRRAAALLGWGVPPVPSPARAKPGPTLWQEVTGLVRGLFKQG